MEEKEQGARRKTMKIGIFGGSFDPVHKEHVALAKAAVESLGLDLLFIVPAKSPPHKPYKTLTADEMRLATCRLAFAEVNNCEVSDYEIARGGTSYTYLTCRHFKEKFPTAQLFWLVGTDMLRDFPTWKHPESILTDATLAVCARAENPEWEEKAQAEFYARFQKNFAVIRYNGADVSATKIRVLAGAGMDITPYTPEKVAAYIKTNGLYVVPYAADALKLLKAERRAHTLRVAETAASKAAQLQIPEKQALVAAIFHDCAKHLTLTDERLKDFTMQAEWGEVPQSVLHQFTGAYIAEKEFGITDSEVLDAIRYHTSGKENMSLLGKLIFLADMVEDGRDFDGVETLRSLFWENDTTLPVEKRLDKCLQAALTQTVAHLYASGKTVYPLTLKAKEFYEK